MIIQLKKTADQVKSLESKENWCLEFDAEFGAITQLVKQTVDFFRFDYKTGALYL